jgi:hypothetical protein
MALLQVPASTRDALNSLQKGSSAQNAYEPVSKFETCSRACANMLPFFRDASRRLVCARGAPVTLSRRYSSSDTIEVEVRRGAL